MTIGEIRAANELLDDRDLLNATMYIEAKWEGMEIFPDELGWWHIKCGLYEERARTLVGAIVGLAREMEDDDHAREF